VSRISQGGAESHPICADFVGHVEFWRILRKFHTALEPLILHPTHLAPEVYNRSCCIHLLLPTHNSTHTLLVSLTRCSLPLAMSISRIYPFFDLDQFIDDTLRPRGGRSGPPVSYEEQQDPRLLKPR
jgi:hypothetical protein